MNTSGNDARVLGYKIEQLIEESFLTQFNDGLAEFFTIFTKNKLNSYNTNCIIDVLSFWFRRSREDNFADIYKKPKYKKFWHQNRQDILEGKQHKYLYRGLYFKTREEKEEALKYMKKNGIRRLVEPFASWTTDKKAAELFLPNDKNRNVNYGVLLRVPFNEVKPNFVFSLEPYLETDIEKRKFTKIIFQQFSDNMENYLRKKQFSFDRKSTLTLTPQILMNSYLIHEYILKTVSFNTDGLIIQNKDRNDRAENRATYRRGN